jgi:hypothetical protein
MGGALMTLLGQVRSGNGMGANERYLAEGSCNMVPFPVSRLAMTLLPLQAKSN